MTDQWKVFRNDLGEQVIVTGDLDGITVPGAEVTKAEIRSQVGVNQRADLQAVFEAIARSQQADVEAGNAMAVEDNDA